MEVVTGYTEGSITTLDWDVHIRRRPGMYIGKLGDGSASDDGIYVLLKEVIDNSIDEFVMGQGKVIEVTIAEGAVSVRDYGRGIPLGKLIDAVSKMNTGAKMDSRAFKKSVGLNGVGKVREWRVQQIGGAKWGGYQGGKCAFILFFRSIS